MKLLITGAGGFGGPHVADAIRAVCGRDTQIVATSKFQGRHPSLGEIETLDVTDRDSVANSIIRHKPTHAIHLAGIAAPAAAAADPQGAWRIHVEGALNLAHAILDHAPNCRLVHVGSGAVYGGSARNGQALEESTVLAPLDDYGVTKAAADLALGALTRRGLASVRMRPFNHTGPGQTTDFVVPAFAMQVARVEAGLAPPVLYTGNLDVERDFLDVRDVATAYALALHAFDQLEPGLILNVASGIPRRIGDVLDTLLSLSKTRITTKLDRDRVRPDEMNRIVGDASLAKMMLGWRPEHDFERTLGEILDYCRAQVPREHGARR